jgi:hypothetical protein
MGIGLPEEPTCDVRAKTDFEGVVVVTTGSKARPKTSDPGAYMLHYARSGRRPSVHPHASGWMAVNAEAAAMAAAPT